MRDITRDFVILGNGKSGTSLLRGLLHAHPLCHVEFELGNQTPKLTPTQMFSLWLDKRESNSASIYGVKMPYELLIHNDWSHDQILNISDYFKVIWIFRRFSKYYSNEFEQAFGSCEVNWRDTQNYYWEMRERYPESIIQVSFEDLILRTEIELRRICYFLDIKYDQSMFSGTNNTGFNKYDKNYIDKSRV